VLDRAKVFFVIPGPFCDPASISSPLKNFSINKLIVTHNKLRSTNTLLILGVEVGSLFHS